MVGQGRCTLSPDDSGRVLDRLAGLAQVISNESVRQALFVTGRALVSLITTRLKYLRMKRARS